MSGETLKTIITEPVTKVENVKKKVAEALGGRWQSYELVYGTHKLQNMKTLVECGIRHDVSVSLIVNHSECKTYHCTYHYDVPFHYEFLPIKLDCMDLLREWTSTQHNAALQ